MGARSFFYLIAVSHFGAMGKSFVLMHTHCCKAGAGFATMKGEGEEEQEFNIVYKTKVVQFLGRQVPIILQNDNGPCPLLAICEFLLSPFYTLVKTWDQISRLFAL